MSKSYYSNEKGYMADITELTEKDAAALLECIQRRQSKAEIRAADKARPSYIKVISSGGGIM